MNIPFRQYWTLLAEHIKPQKTRFMLLVFLLLSSVGLRLYNPQLVRDFIDAISEGASAQTLLYAGLAYIGMTLFQQGVSVSATYLGESVAWTATNALRAQLARHCLGLDMRFHNEHTPGELIERIDGDVAQLSLFFSQLVVRVLSNLVLMIGIIVVLAFEEWRLALALTVFAGLALWILDRVRGLAVSHYKAIRESSAELFGFLEEQLNSTEDIRSSGAVGFVLRGLFKRQRKVLGHRQKASLMSMRISIATNALMFVLISAGLVTGYMGYRSEAFTLGTVYLIMQYINLLGQPIQELTRQIQGLQAIGAAVERLNELRAIQSQLVDGSQTLPTSGALALTFDDVSFSYVEEEPVLEHIAFELSPGTVLGLLGRTGSGKTTLARLIFRLYDPTQGQILLDGTNFVQFKLNLLRQRVALVTQDVQLFQASVRDNLTFFNRSISDERIHEVIETLELSDWYASLPDGLDTELETGARSLSAGEAQLLAFTRVFLRDPGLVILDEASSRLDPATEQHIERAVDKLLQGRTAIVIAHRLGTVERADDILILEEGQVGEYGNRCELAADPQSRFFDLLQTGLEEVLA